jgi:hypothetical protein
MKLALNTERFRNFPHLSIVLKVDPCFWLKTPILYFKYIGPSTYERPHLRPQKFHFFVIPFYLQSVQIK